MTTYVAFLRGVNLGPHRALSMPRLVELAEGLGHEDVWTYLRTGNLVLTSTQAAGTVERGLARALEEEYGTTTDVTVRTADQLRALVADNPFPDGSASQVTVTFLTADPPPGLEDRLAAVATPAEPYEVHGREVWVRFGDGLARSRLAAGLSKVVGVSATTRTVGTVAKLVAGIDKRAG